MAGQRLASPAAEGGIRKGGEPKRWGTFVGWMLVAAVTGAAMGSAMAIYDATHRTASAPGLFNERAHAAQPIAVQADPVGDRW